MNNTSCSICSELLVDYADGELTAADQRRVADHLATCLKCQAELLLLQRSLELARAAWHEAASPQPTACLTHGTPVVAGRRPRVWHGLVACGAVAIVLLAFTLWQTPRPPEGQSASAIAQQKAVAERTWTKEEIDAYISRQTRAARLAVAVELLASQPGLEEYKIQAERYSAKVSGAPMEGP